MSDFELLQRAPVQARVLRIFISYAREDENIAVAVVNALTDLLGGSGLCDVTFDKYSFEVGEEIKEQIQCKLEATDFLLIIYTGVNKPSHSYTGYEVGFFESIMRRESDRDIERKIVPLFLHSPPVVNGETLGIKFDITREDLLSTEDAFKAKLVANVNAHHPAVTFLESLVQIVDREGHKIGLMTVNRPPPVDCVQKMLLNIFNNLKPTVDEILKPQKQIVLRTSGGALGHYDNRLPGTAVLTPLGLGNVMEVFGLPNEEITWENFQRRVLNHSFGSSWCEAITSVIVSSLPNPLEIDNSQMLVSKDGAHFYRLILTTGAIYYNGNQEFNLYLVEALSLGAFGNETTTLLLNGLRITCLFRFMFLESESEFSVKNVSLASSTDVPEIARNLLKALNLLRQSGEQARLHKAAIWSQFVDWKIVKEMIDNWQPLEEQMRDLAGKILLQDRARSSHDELDAMRDELAQLLAQVADSTGKYNQLLIQAINAKLRIAIEAPV